MKIHSRQMHAPLRGRFEPNSGYIAHYAPFIWLKSPTNCDAHLSESNFQTRSSEPIDPKRKPGNKDGDGEAFKRRSFTDTNYEQIIFSQLDSRTDAVWSLFLASGYLRVKSYFIDEEWGQDIYELALTNREVRFMFGQMIDGWFKDFIPEYNDFVKAMLTGDIKAMNVYMNKIALHTISYFDSGTKPSEASEPERFYQGFVLGLTVELAERYVITSNRESGFGRYDVVLEPKRQEDCAVIMEFKVRDSEEEATLEATAKEVLAQIERKKYGFAFEGKQVLIQS